MQLSSEFGIPKTLLLSSKYDTNGNKNFRILQQPAVAHANSLIHVPAGGRAITSSPYFDYFDNQQKLKNHETTHIIASAAATAPSSMITNDKTTQSVNVITINTWPIKPKITTTTTVQFSLPTLSTIPPLSLHNDDFTKTSRESETLGQFKPGMHLPDNNNTDDDDGRNLSRDDRNKLLLKETADVKAIKTSLINAEQLDQVKCSYLLLIVSI